MLSRTFFGYMKLTEYSEDHRYESIDVPVFGFKSRVQRMCSEKRSVPEKDAPFPKVCDIHGQEMKQLQSFEKLLLVMIHRHVHRECCLSGFIRL